MAILSNRQKSFVSHRLDNPSDCWQKWKSRCDIFLKASGASGKPDKASVLNQLKMGGKDPVIFFNKSKWHLKEG
jgi:hypothetical protein